MCATKILYREFWGATKRSDILATLDKSGAEFDAEYKALRPVEANRFNLRVSQASGAYATWPNVREIAAEHPHNGPVERRALALIDMDGSALRKRMKAYFDPNKSDAEVASLHPGLLMVGNGINGPADRKKLQQRQAYRSTRVRSYPWKPFDVRWAYLDDVAPLFSRPNVPLQGIAELPAVTFFVTRDDADTPDEGPPTYLTRLICDYDFLRGHARLFPVELPAAAVGVAQTGAAQFTLDYARPAYTRPNLSPAAVAWLSKLNLPATPDTSRQVWHHALAITYSPAWLAENAEGIRQGWPRIPLPGRADLLAASAALGEQVAALLDPDTPVPGVTSGAVRPELAAIAVPSTAPGTKRDWTLTGWGHRTEKGVTMPGRGRTEPRRYTEAEAATGAQSHLLGGQTFDVWMNGASFWRNIPETVWDTHIGGYQVLKKWLSYRDGSILGRPLSEAEVAHVQATARRLAALRLMGPALDASFRACAAAHVPLPG